MKLNRILITLILIFILGLKTNAQSQYSGLITKMEKSLFGMDYGTQSDDTRIKRIEETVYGAPSSKPLQERVDKLSKDLSADLIGQEIKAKKDTFAEDEDSIKEEPIAKADSNINYPSVDILEKEVFNKTFKGNDINQRLSNMEQQVFKKTFNDDLNTRVDRLKKTVMPERLAYGNQGEDEYDPSSDNQDTYLDEQPHYKNGINPNAFGYNVAPTGFGAQVPSLNSKNNFENNFQDGSDISIPLAQLEKVVLKRSYPDDVPSNRLSRLEIKIFNSTFTDDDEQTRLDRVTSAYRAKKTAKKYDSNKFAQHTATAMQIGAILLMILAAIL